jgi:hypothetical protein
LNKFITDGLALTAAITAEMARKSPSRNCVAQVAQVARRGRNGHSRGYQLGSGPARQVHRFDQPRSRLGAKGTDMLARVKKLSKV